MWGRGSQAERSTCQGPEVGPFLVCLRNSGEDDGLEQSGRGAARPRGRGSAMERAWDCIGRGWETSKGWWQPSAGF